jgi:hypothetical protein
MKVGYQSYHQMLSASKFFLQMEFLGLILQDPIQQKQKHLADMYEKKSNVSMLQIDFE